MTIKQKLFGVMLVVLAIVVGLGAFSLWQLKRVSSTVAGAERQMDKFSQVTDLQLAIGEAVMPANDFIITRKSEYGRLFLELDAEVRRIGASLRAAEDFSPEERVAIERSLKLYDGLARISRQILDSDASRGDLGALMEQMDYDYAAPAVEAVQGLRSALRARLAATRDEARATQGLARRVIVTAILVLALGSFVMTNMIGLSITRALAETNAMLRSIAEGSGNLTARLYAGSRDEIGSMASWFNLFIERLHGMVREITGVSREISGNAAALEAAAAGVLRSSRRQLEATSATASSTAELAAATRSIEEEAGKLLSYGERVAGASVELSSGIDVLVDQAGQLDGAADASASSVQEISAAMRQVSTNTGSLLGQTDSVVASVEQLRAAIAEVSGVARQQASLAERTRETAGAGLDAVRRTREGVAGIESEAAQTAERMRSLRERSREIDEIVAVIAGVADTTNLLALNASILAAQAGKHGAGFAVVATEIKKLAERSNASTAEIATRIGLIQADILAAAQSLGRVSERVTHGFGLSEDAARVIERILAGTDEAFDLSKRVETAVAEQRGAIEDTVRRMRAIREMTEQTAEATVEQGRAADHILRGTEQIRGATAVVGRALAEQSRESRELARATQEALSRMQAIARAAGEQSQAVEHIARAVVETQGGAEANSAAADSLAQIVTVMQEHGGVLDRRIGGFQV